MIHDLYEVYETDLSLSRTQAGLRQQCFGIDLAESKAMKLLGQAPERDFLIFNATVGQVCALAFSEASRRAWDARKK